MTTTVNGHTIAAGSASWVDIEIAHDLGLRTISIPTYVINGHQDGPTLWLQGQIHGDENVCGLSLRDFLLDVSPEDVRGTIIGLPVVSMSAFENQRREPPMDGKDPIRDIPPRDDGTSTFTSQFTSKLTSLAVRHADYVVDLHSHGQTGTCEGFAIFPRTGDRVGADSRRMAKVSGLVAGTGIDLSKYQVGMWTALADNGIPSITTEIGGARARQEYYDRTVQMLTNVAGEYVLDNEIDREHETTIHEDLHFAFNETGGFFTSQVELGEVVEKGQRLGTITSLRGRVKEEMTSPEDASVLSMHHDGVIRPGYKPFMLGVN